VIYLSGCYQKQFEGHVGGFLKTPEIGNRLPAGTTWAADTGLFSPRAKYSDERYLKWLDKQERAACLFATAPDVPFDWAGTWARSLPMFEPIRALGYKVAVVAQDGAEDDPALDWSLFDVLFIGGSTEWKISKGSLALSSRAQALGKWVHVGRVNSAKRYINAALLGADSADGNFLRFGPDVNLPKLKRWTEQARRMLPLVAYESSYPAFGRGLAEVAPAPSSPPEEP
jgi:hypothetical protein